MGASPATRSTRPIQPTVWRVTDRAGFAALRHHGARAQHGGLAVTHVPAAGDQVGQPPRVAYAVGRSAGSAVARNRIRRRVRAAVADLAARGALPAGTYLVGAGPGLGDRPWAELLADLETAVDRATRRVAG